MIASGKSTYCKTAAKHGYVVINDDAIVNMLHADDYTLYDPKLKVLYKAIENNAISTALAFRKNVIIDRGLNVSVQGRSRWLSLAKSFDVTCDALVFRNEGPKVHAERRMKADGRGHPSEYWLRVAEVHNSLYVPPTQAEGFNAVYEISYDDILSGRIAI